jgi:hypothetical protein
MQECYTPAQQKSRNKWLHTGCLYTETEQIPASLQDKIIAVMNYKTFNLVREGTISETHRQCHQVFEKLLNTSFVA